MELKEGLFSRINLFKSKRGLSEVITTMIIILLAIVVTAIIWVVVKNFVLKGAEDTNLEKFSYNLNIRGAYLTVENSENVVKVIVLRNSGGGNLTGLRFAFSDGSDDYIVDRKTNLLEIQEKTFTFNSTEVGVSSVIILERVSIAPIYESSRKDIVGDIVDTAIIGRNAPPGGQSGGGITTCGNGVCETGETQINCPIDCTPGQTPVCGNNLIESGEQCECGNDRICGNSDDNLNGNSCTTIPGGYTGGILRCNLSCQFNVSQCTGAPPASCNGAWTQEDIQAGVQCDGGPNCRPDCTCRVGYTSNGLGGCYLNPPVNTGTILSVWPPGAKKYFDSENLPKDSSQIAPYTSYYINFSNSIETRCFRITFAEYIPSVNRSYLRIIDTANINAGENYSVWEAENCGQ
ncbi:MAG: hypothetical protein QXD63_01455 [Candidatus Pacearchaeota archaeon]